jgi:hypothetical protein
MLLSTDQDSQPEDPMSATRTSITAIVKAIENAFDGHWGVWLSDTGRWWATRHATLTTEAINAGCVPFLRAGSPNELAERIRKQDGLHPGTGQDTGKAPNVCR